MRRQWTTRGYGAVGLLLAALLFMASAASTFAGRKPVTFAASGQITGVDAGDVKAAGKSGRFVVKNRTLTGWLTGSIVGSFSFTFHTNVPLLQAPGQFHGPLVMNDPELGRVEAKANVTSEIGGTPFPCPVANGFTCIPTPEGNRVPGLLFSGTFTFVDGAQGHGRIEAWLIPILSDTGHVIGILTGQLQLEGTWH